MKKCNCEKNCKCASKKSVVECDCDIIHTDLVESVRQKVLSEEVLFAVADFYKVMSDSTRVKILDLLKESELCVCDISAVLNMTKSAVSHQLKNLREVNLVKARKQGKEVWYSLADKHIVEVFDVTLEHILEGEENE